MSMYCIRDHMAVLTAGCAMNQDQVYKSSTTKNSVRSYLSSSGAG